MGIILYCMICGELPFNGKTYLDTKELIINE
jgi:hypothetical protein